MSCYLLTLDEHVDGLTLGHVGVEPVEHSVGVYVLVKVIHQVAEDHTLLACPVSRHPQPAVSHVIVHKEYVPFLETGIDFT